MPHWRRRRGGANSAIAEGSDEDDDILGLDSGPLGSTSSLYSCDTVDEAGGAGRSSASSAKSRNSHSRPRTDLEIFMWAYGLSEYRIRQAHDPERFAALDVVGAPEEPGKRGHWRPIIVLFVNGAVFQNATFALIGLNAIFMGMQANATVAVSQGKPHPETLYIVIDSLFVIGFLLEIFFRIAGRTHRILADQLLLTDIFVVATSAIESWVVGPVTADNSTNQLAMLSVFRLVRILKITKLFRVLGFAKPLQLLTRCLIDCIQNVFCVIMVLTLVVFGWSNVVVLMLGPSTEVFDELPLELQSRFSSVSAGALTMMEIALNGDMWGSRVLRPLFDLSGFNFSVASFVLVGFSCCMHLWLLALITGLFIEQTFIESDRLDQRLDEDSIMRGQFGVRNLKAMFKQMDTNKDSDLSWTEFEAGLQANPALMKKLDLSMRSAKLLYKELAIDMDGKVSVDEFLFGIIRHTQRTKSVDMTTIDFEQQRTLVDLRALGSRCSRDMARLTKEMNQQLVNVSCVRPDVDALSVSVEAELQRVHDSGDLRRSTRPARSTGVPDVCITPGGAGPAAWDQAKLPTPRDRGREAVAVLNAQLTRLETAAGLGGRPAAGDAAAWRSVAAAEGRPKIRAELRAALSGLTRAPPTPPAAPLPAGPVLPASGPWAPLVSRPTPTRPASVPPLKLPLSGDTAGAEKEVRRYERDPQELGALLPASALRPAPQLTAR